MGRKAGEESPNRLSLNWLGAFGPSSQALAQAHGQQSSSSPLTKVVSTCVGPQSPDGGQSMWTSRIHPKQEIGTVPDKFDPYREALIMEFNTIWPEEYDELEPQEKQRISDALHADPENCANLEYIRVHTGFCRQITVTYEDIERLSG